MSEIRSAPPGRRTARPFAAAHESVRTAPPGAPRATGEVGLIESSEVDPLDRRQVSSIGG